MRGRFTLVFLFIGLAAGAAAQESQAIQIGTRVGGAPGTYDAAGRRDPFVSLIQPKAEPRAPVAAVKAGVGLAAIAVSEVQVKGVIHSGPNLIALLSGPDGRTFVAHRADHLMDGVVARIEPDAVVFTERSADAAGLIHPRDVRKTLRPSSGGRP